MFMKELSFPQTAPTDDALFQPELGWSVWGSLGWTKITDGLNWRIPDRLGWDRIAAMLTCGLRSWYFSAKTRKKGGRRGLCPWPLRCLSQTLSERKERMLRLFSNGVPFSSGAALYL